MKIVFSPDAFASMGHFKKHDAKTAGKIIELTEDILRTPHAGLGKPEPLKHGLSGYWSRRINREHRLVYKVEDGTLFIVSCQYYYR